MPTVDQIDRGLVLCVAGARAHPAGHAGRAGVAGGDGNYDDDGGRSLGDHGFDAAESKRASFCARHALRETTNAQGSPG